jgi:hypothetical protein
MMNTQLARDVIPVGTGRRGTRRAKRNKQKNYAKYTSLGLHAKQVAHAHQRKIVKYKVVCGVST